MALKRSKYIGAFILILLYNFSHLQAQYNADTMMDEVYINQNSSDENYAPQSMDVPTAAEEQKNWQDDYEMRAPKGVELDKDKLDAELAKLDYKVKEPKVKEKKKSDQNTLKKENIRRESGSFWVGSSGKVIAYTIAVICVIILLAMIITRMTKKGSRATKSEVLVEIGERIDAKTLANLEVDDQLSVAMEQADYRLGVRLLYLNSLKLLMEKGIIKPSPEKTNFDYVRELAGNAHQNEFRNTTSIFEKIWYGESNLDRVVFQQVKNRFSHFQDNIRLGK